MLKYRLIFGTLMTLLFTAVAVLDAWLDGSLTASAADDKQVQGTLICILVALLLIPAQLELSKLAAAKGLTIFTGFSTVASIIVATGWYWCQFLALSFSDALALLLVFLLLVLFFYQYLRRGTAGVLANCAVNLFSILYLGLLGAFVLAVRVEFGLWHLLMSVFVVKCADIGAYAIGRSLGRHKFSPNISPGKTWEGMASAVVTAVAVAVAFAAIFDIMSCRLAVLFGVCFAFIGQLGDLAESMIKRDARQKDSSGNVPGFGGILDVIDSPLVAGPFAYLFFVITAA